MCLLKLDLNLIFHWSKMYASTCKRYKLSTIDLLNRKASSLNTKSHCSRAAGVLVSFFCSVWAAKSCQAVVVFFLDIIGRTAKRSVYRQCSNIDTIDISAVYHAGLDSV